MLLAWGVLFLQIHILKRRDKVSVNKENKKQLVSELASQLKDAKSIVFVDYRGLTVAEDTVMRRNFRNENVTYKVCKNTLFKLALKEIGVTDFDEKNLEGTTAVVFGNDEVAPARLFCKSAKDFNKMEVKFGIVDGKVMDKNGIEALAKVPSREVLIAMLLGTLQGPISALARALNGIAEKKQEN